MNAPDVDRGTAIEAESLLPSRGQDEPLFRLAWHARAFALIVSLVKDGHIAWPVFQDRLVGRIIEDPAPGKATAEAIDLHYFDCWLEALHDTLVAEGFVDEHDLTRQIDVIHSTVAQVRADQLAQSADPARPLAVDGV